jgi:hypothetical protein
MAYLGKGKNNSSQVLTHFNLLKEVYFLMEFRSFVIRKMYEVQKFSV